MQAKWGKELRDLVRSEAFVAWFRDYNVLREQSTKVRARVEELTSDASVAQSRVEAHQKRAEECVYAAGELEDQASLAQAEFARIENTSFEMLSQFETTRSRGTESWQEADRLDKLVDDETLRIEDLRRRAEAARKQGTNAGISEADRLDARARDLAGSHDHTKRHAQEAHARLRNTENKKQQLWVDVEGAWSKAFHANMARSEYTYQSRRARAEAETLYGQAAVERRRMDGLLREAETLKEQLREVTGQFAKHLHSASERFGCVLVEEFLFWPQEGNVTCVWVLPLVDERRHFNIQVTALQLYQVDRARGLDFIEPVPDEATESRSNDPRLEQFFAPRRKDGG